jgi:Domain of unknown function (DUF4328)
MRGVAQTRVPTAPRPLRARSIAAALLLGANLIIATLLCLAHGYELTLLRRIRANLPVENSVRIATDGLVDVCSSIWILTFVVTAVVFLVWLHRASENLRAFRSESLDFTPGQAVRSFFIPFVNLIRPFQVMREVWQASDPDIPPMSSASFRTTDTSPVVLVWWLLVLGSGALGRFAGGDPVSWLTGHTVGLTLANMIYLTRGAVAMYLVRALAAGAAIGMVFLIDRRQNDLIVALKHPLPKNSTAIPFVSA